MTKLLIPLISFFIGNASKLFKEPGQALTQQLVLHVRSITLLIVSTIGSLVLFLVGASFLVSYIVNQVEKDGGFQATTGFIIYTAMVLVSGGVLTYSLRSKTWLKSLGMQTQAEPQAKKSGAIESAVALLIMDFVEERQARRESHPPTDS
jgi:hypothetical protein